MNNQPSNLVPLLLMGFVAWRMFRRIRRNIGRQRLQPKRMIASIVIFAVVIVLMGAATVLLSHTMSMAGLGAGLLLGVPIALVGLHLTRFEAADDGHYYTPNTYIGIALSLLLLARVFYRILRIYAAPHLGGDAASAGFTQSPLTLFLFGLAASYYIAYYIGIFIRCRELKPVTQ